MHGKKEEQRSPIRALLNGANQKVNDALATEYRGNIAAYCPGLHPRSHAPLGLVRVEHWREPNGQARVDRAGAWYVLFPVDRLRPHGVDVFQQSNWTRRGRRSFQGPRQATQVSPASREEISPRGIAVYCFARPCLVLTRDEVRNLLSRAPLSSAPSNRRPGHKVFPARRMRGGSAQHRHCAGGTMRHHG